MSRIIKELALPREEVSAAGVEAMRALPGFRTAMRRSAESSIALHRGGRLLGWILGDRARAVFGHVLMYLDATYDPADQRSGLTPSAVKELCAELELCSPNRAGAMLALMQVAGFVAPAGGASDARVKRLVPTEKLKALQRDRMAGQVEALALLAPEMRPALDRVGDTRFEQQVAIGFAGYFFGGFRVLQHAEPLRLFAERSTGIVLLYHWLLQGFEAPGRPMELSIAELSRRYGVSRVHIVRLLRDAETAGLVQRQGNSLSLTPLCLEMAEWFVATTLLLWRSVLTRALQTA